MMNTLSCSSCGHEEAWEDGGYCGEHTDFAHHVCGKPGGYAMCGPGCDHSFPGCAGIPDHPLYNRSSDTFKEIKDQLYAQDDHNRTLVLDWIVHQYGQQLAG